MLKRKGIGHAIAAVLLMGAGMAGSRSTAAVVHAGEPAGKPMVEVCFVLDTTGSMGGLIEGAKVKIWSIANRMIAADPTPDLKIALIGYRDRGDEYVTRIHDLEDDIDMVYRHLQNFQAGGGGDMPESVNQALHEAVNRIGWSADRGVLKIIFLVGDCPPHMDYPDDVPYTETCREAVRRDLIINTVQCGNHPQTTPVWKTISRRAEGQFVAIGQTGDMQVISTPMDERLAELNVALGRTLVPYGGEADEREVRLKQAAAEASAAPAAADRLAYYSRTGKVVGGGGDLVEDLREGRVTLEELDGKRLPEELKDLSPAEQRAWLERQASERSSLQEEIDALLERRQAYINNEMRRLAEEGREDAFDIRVGEMLAEQAGRKGIRYGSVEAGSR